jgi:glutamine amidotransferase
MKIGIINFGIGNIHSLSNALNEIKTNYCIIESPSDLYKVDAFILPGVGSFTDSKKRLDENNWTQEIIEQVKFQNKAMLGICLGMQLLADSGTEGHSTTATPGLGLISGNVNHLSTFGCNLRTPHVGWNSINKIKKSSILENLNSGSDFYFVHSYAFTSTNQDHIIATTQYGIDFPVVIQKERIFGVQFHPEKSSKAGFLILKNFIKLTSC